MLIRTSDGTLRVNFAISLSTAFPYKTILFPGIISNEITGEPIKNAEVICRGSSKFDTNTNASGYFEFINLKDGKWKLRIKAKGYKKGKSRVEISGGGTYKQDIKLNPREKVWPQIIRESIMAGGL